MRHRVPTDDRRDGGDIDDWIDRGQPVGKLGVPVPDQILRYRPCQGRREDDDVRNVERSGEVRRVHQRRRREEEYHRGAQAVQYPLRPIAPQSQTWRGREIGGCE